MEEIKAAKNQTLGSTWGWGGRRPGAGRPPKVARSGHVDWAAVLARLDRLEDELRQLRVTIEACAPLSTIERSDA